MASELSVALSSTGWTKVSMNERKERRDKRIIYINIGYICQAWAHFQRRTRPGQKKTP